MNVKHIFFLVMGILSACVTKVPQDSDPASRLTVGKLAEIEGEILESEEFLYVLSKNSTEDQTGFTKAEFDENLTLFLNYRLKVKYAEELEMDQDEAFIAEFETFKEEVKRPFLMEHTLEEKELKKAYERMGQMVKASHILIQIPPAASKEDSSAVLAMAEKLKSRIDSGDNFNELAVIHSDDPSVGSNEGNLGYFTALQMVAPFEEAAFDLSPGEVSDPILTDFGYHIIKLEEKMPNPGDLRVSHLLVRTDPQDPSADERAKDKIQKIYGALENGESDWEEMVRLFSEDAGSKDNAGLVPWFGVGAIVPEFESAAFSLNHIGELSPPVKTVYGYHILRLEEKRPVPPYEELESTIKSKLLKGSRTEQIKMQAQAMSREKFDFKEQYTVKEELFDFIENHRSSTFDDLKTKHDLAFGQNSIIIYSNVDTLETGEFLSFIEKDYRPGKSNHTEGQYERFVEKNLSLWEEQELWENNNEYRQLIREFRNGILIFNLMNEFVWEKAIQDSLGQRTYFHENREKYQWPERIPALILTMKKNAASQEIKTFLSENQYHKDIENILQEKFLKENPLLFTYKNGIEEIEGNSLLSRLDLDKKFQEVVHEGTEFMVLLGDLIPSAPKTFEETKGKVIQDYQSHLDEKLVRELNDKYTILINEDEKRRIYEAVNP